MNHPDVNLKLEKHDGYILMGKTVTNT